METRRVETTLIVTKGSDGKLYDLHRVAHAWRPKALGPDAPWFETRVEWLTSTGVIVQTDDETTFRLGEILLTATAELNGSVASV